MNQSDIEIENLTFSEADIPICSLIYLKQSRIIACSYDKGVILYNPETGKHVKSRKCAEGTIVCDFVKWKDNEFLFCSSDKLTHFKILSSNPIEFKQTEVLAQNSIQDLLGCVCRINENHVVVCGGDDDSVIVVSVPDGSVVTKKLIKEVKSNDNLYHFQLGDVYPPKFISSRRKNFLFANCLCATDENLVQNELGEKCIMKGVIIEFQFNPIEKMIATGKFFHFHDVSKLDTSMVDVGSMLFSGQRKIFPNNMSIFENSKKQELLITSVDYYLFIFDVLSGNILTKFEGYDDYISSVFSIGYNLFFVGDENGKFNIAQFDERKGFIQIIKSHPGKTQESRTGSIVYSSIDVENVIEGYSGEMCFFSWYGGNGNNLHRLRIKGLNLQKIDVQAQHDLDERIIFIRERNDEFLDETDSGTRFLIDLKLRNYEISGIWKILFL